MAAGRNYSHLSENCRSATRAGRLGEKNADVLIPGYTHLQRAQPVYFAHHLLAYVEMLERDQRRLADCFMRASMFVRSAAAPLPDHTLPLNRELVAKLLGFVDAKGRPQLTQNSMDAVSDRDFAVEFCAAAALLAVHLSRLAEDLILWASAEFNFIKIADAYTTGSSLDAAEEKSGRGGTDAGQNGPGVWQFDVAADAAEGLADDLQSRFAGGQGTAVRHGGHRARHDAADGGDVAKHDSQSRGLPNAPASDPALLATDLADYLVRKGMPFRQAHHVVGAVVALAEKSGKPLNPLTLTELQSVDKAFGRDARAVFDLEKAMAKRNIIGAPGTKEVARQLARWRRQLS